MILRRLAACLLAAATLTAAAQEAEGLASAPARAFRQRVADLAVIYGDARGIDPQGLLVIARMLPPLHGGCADVEVAVGPEAEPLLREILRGCRPAGG